MEVQSLFEVVARQFTSARICADVNQNQFQSSKIIHRIIFEISLCEESAAELLRPIPAAPIRPDGSANA